MIGRFYFRRTNCGNLLGEFSNNLSRNNLPQRVIQTESADAINPTTDFIGTYTTTWTEVKNAINAILTISFKPETNEQIFTLIWTENNVPIFWGEGMRCGDLLIGAYRDQP